LVVNVLPKEITVVTNIVTSLWLPMELGEVSGWLIKCYPNRVQILKEVVHRLDSCERNSDPLHLCVVWIDCSLDFYLFDGKFHRLYRYLMSLPSLSA